jgi:hypothetical protein
VGERAGSAVGGAGCCTMAHRWSVGAGGAGGDRRSGQSPIVFDMRCGRRAEKAKKDWATKPTLG